MNRTFTRTGRKPASRTTNGIHIPAHSPDAELSVLGAILLNNARIDDVAEFIQVDHFYVEDYQKVFAAMTDLAEQGIPFDTVTLAEALIRRGDFDADGVTELVVRIGEAVPHSAHAVHYAETVRENFDRRKLYYATTQGTAWADDKSLPVRESAEKLAGEMLTLLDQRGAKSKLQVCDTLPDTLAIIQQRIEQEREISGLTTGFADLDRQTTGLHPAQLVILAARPAMGKTALIGNVAVNIADADKDRRLLFISLEQSVNELNERLLAARALVNAHDIRSGNLSPADQQRIWDAAEWLAGLPIFIDDRPGQTLAQIRATARRLNRQHRLGAIIIDYLQLIQPESSGQQREQQVAAISRGLKFLAKELEIPVIALAQLNRGVEIRENKRPKLADLRESGSIEQDADIVMILHRPDAYDAEDQPGVAELNIAKHRSGPTGLVRLTWRKEYMRFENYSPIQDVDCRGL